MTVRVPTRVVLSMEASDGAGVKLRRSIGSPTLRNLDPFLMLDAFGTDNPDDYIAGFPPHPHRGFETVTYMLAGNMQHRDSVGNEGNLVAGSVQWMTAGRGIIHSEMPQQAEGRMSGFQLWINLPAADKMCAPAYQDLPPEAMPVVATEDGAIVKIIAGTFEGVRGPIAPKATDPTMLDATLPPGASIRLAVRPDDAAFFYAFEGAVSAGGAEPVADRHLAVLGPGDEIVLTGGPSGGRALLLVGRPLREPIVQYGPFVMTSNAEIHEAIRDYQQGRFGT
jgi:redox-sensitive bicupin YhaK (pirin superfamily)